MWIVRRVVNYCGHLHRVSEERHCVLESLGSQSGQTSLGKKRKKFLDADLQPVIDTGLVLRVLIVS